MTLGMVILIYIINSVFYLNSQSITYDEGSFLNYAIRYVKGDPQRLSPLQDDSKMPVISLNLLPRIIQQLMNPGFEKSDNGVSDIMTGRYISLFFSLFTLCIVFIWASKLYGSKNAFLSVLMLSFCPNFLAVSSFVTTDTYSVLFLVLTIFLLWSWLQKPCLQKFIYLSVSIACSQVVKQSLSHLYILMPLLLLVYYLVNKPAVSKIMVGKYLLIFISIQLLIINLTYYFSGSFQAIETYHFTSNLFNSVKSILPSTLPIPLPSPYIYGLDYAIYINDLGGGINGISGFGNITILGKQAMQGGFWYYYFVTIFFKTPIPYLIILFLTFVMLFIKAKKNKKEFFQNEWLIVGTVIYYLIYFSFFYKTQLGVRHIVFLYPLLYVMTGLFFASINGLKMKLLVSICMLYHFISVTFYFRNYYPYTNEFIKEKESAYWFVGAANLDIGQGKLFVDNYLKRHPQVKMVPDIQRNGLFLIDVGNYLDIWNLHKNDWIKRYKPIDHVAFSWLLIKVDNLK